MFCFLKKTSRIKKKSRHVLSYVMNEVRLGSSVNCFFNRWSGISLQEFNHIIEYYQNIKHRMTNRPFIHYLAHSTIPLWPSPEPSPSPPSSRPPCSLWCLFFFFLPSPPPPPHLSFPPLFDLCLCYTFPFFLSLLSSCSSRLLLSVWFFFSLVKWTVTNWVSFRSHICL